jgi:hypothetical protein
VTGGELLWARKYTFEFPSTAQNFSHNLSDYYFTKNNALLAVVVAVVAIIITIYIYNQKLTETSVLSMLRFHAADALPFAASWLPVTFVSLTCFTVNVLT